MQISFIPYPGLRPYNYEESKLFFGRERHIAEILHKLETRRFVSIVGNSGSGKSSIVKAGVLPALAKDNSSWIIATFRPGENPVRNLSDFLFSNQVFTDASFTAEGAQRNYDILQKSNLGLVQVVRPLLPAGKRLLILVDQFEELFRFVQLHQQSDESVSASHFVNLLLGAISQQDVPIYVMMTLRSDFLGDCEQFEGLPEAINDGQFLIPRMNRDDLSRSITGPIREVDGKISPRLVQQLLSEIGTNPDQLPILQHVLMRSWEVWMAKDQPEQPMDIDDYLATGGMNEALSNHAEEAYNELKTDKKKRIAETLFKTITVKTSDNRGVRRPSTIKTIAQIAESTVDEVIEVAEVFRRSDRGFLMPPANVSIKAESIIDISHESLMRVWRRLKNWVDEEGESADFYERITSNALLYEQDKASLWRNPDLQIALDWKEKQQPNEFWAKQYNSHFNKSIRFIEASENEYTFFLNNKARSRKILIFSSIVLLVALSALAIWALSERNNAEINAKNALAEKAKTEEQKQRAEVQTSIAEQNLVKAKEEERRAQKLQIESEEQRKIAVNNAEQARLSKQRAEIESEKAIQARKQAEIERQIAKNGKILSDSLRQTAEKSEKKSNRLSMLSLSQNLAIRSKIADKNASFDHIKTLLALQAYTFNKDFGGKELDPEIQAALFSAYRNYQKPSDYINNTHTDEVKSICYNPANGDLVSVGSDGTVVVTPKKNPAIFTASTKSSLIFTNVAYNESGSQIVVACDDNSLHIYNAAFINSPSIIIQDLHPKPINSIKWNEEQIITAAMDNKIRIIDIKTKKVIKVFAVPTKPEAIDYYPKSNTLYVGGENGKVYTADLTNDAELTQLLDVKHGKISCLDLNKDGSLLVVGTNSGVCQVIGLKNNKVVSSLTGHQAGVQSVRFSPKNNDVATACLDKKVRLYSTKESVAQPVIFPDHTNWVLDVAFSPDGNELASCGRDKLIITYPIDPLEMVKFLENNVGKNLTKSEWDTYISPDIAYQKTIPNLN
jgi:energy-coupling factor transporter ATP-binding protein EcfA2